MYKLKSTLRQKILASFKSSYHILARPIYFLMAILLSFVMAGVIIWSLNSSLVWYVLSSPGIDFLKKLEFVFDGYRGLFGTIKDFQSFSILLFSGLFGINFSMLVFALNNFGLHKVPKKSGGAAALFALFGGGCVACGTSLLTPALTTLGVTTGFLAREIGIIMIWIGIVLTLYSIYRISKVTGPRP